jgi:hypothetical protein
MAPAEKIGRHLAIFHRFFTAWDEAASAQDLERLWLCQWVADTLHNVPTMLTCDHDFPFWSTAPIESWVTRFPAYLSAMPGTPPRLVDESRVILSFSKPWERLALQEDLSDLDLAPLSQFAWSMRIFGWAFLEMRQRANWEDMSPADWEWTVRLGAAAQPIAQALAPLPAGLVHWRDFDLAGFRKRIHEVWPVGHDAWGLIGDPHPDAH